MTTSPPSHIPASGARAQTGGAQTRRARTRADALRELKLGALFSAELATSSLNGASSALTQLDFDTAASKGVAGKQQVHEPQPGALESSPPE